MNVRKIIPRTDEVRALLNTATIDMLPYNSTAAQLVCIREAIAKLQQLEATLQVNGAMQ
jgi:hypothetical protein